MKRNIKMKNMLSIGVIGAICTNAHADKETGSPYTDNSVTKVSPSYDYVWSKTEAKLLPKGYAWPKVSWVMPLNSDSESLMAPAGTVGHYDTKSNGNARTQKEFDVFSWSVFIALNWPAYETTTKDGVKGDPITSVTLGDKPDTARVWEHYMAPSSFFKAKGKPDAWGTTYSPNKTLNSTSKDTHFLDEIDEAFFTINNPMPPIVDLNQEYVWYEVRFNKSEYDFMNDNELYTQSGQLKHLVDQLSNPNNKAKIYFDFPWPTETKPGAMELKVAWKKMGENDDSSKFYTVMAQTADLSGKDDKEYNKEAQYGMVAMHIAVKTKNAPQWVWATFEHESNNPRVDYVNLTDDDPKVDYDKTGSYSFWKDTAEGKSSVAGFDGDTYRDLVTLGKSYAGDNLQKKFYQDQADRKPTLITQVITNNNSVISSEWTDALNAQMKKALLGTVWENYRLVSTQWPTDGSENQKDSPWKSPSTGKPLPYSLGNPVMETYLQVNGSCMGCHAGATSPALDVPKQLLPKTQPVPTTPISIPSNFSFMLERAIQK